MRARSLPVGYTVHVWQEHARRHRSWYYEVAGPAGFTATGKRRNQHAATVAAHREAGLDYRLTHRRTR